VIRGVATILFGLACIAAGAYLYLAPGAKARIRQAFVFRTGLVPSRGLWGEIPLGSAAVCFGIAMLSPNNSLNSWLVVLGGVLLVIAIIAMLWAPNWIRPRWARDNKASGS
jgi:protein-S-isoprenylcysteine O-methyltransferase Ste14